MARRAMGNASISFVCRLAVCVLLCASCASAFKHNAMKAMDVKGDTDAVGIEWKPCGSGSLNVTDISVSPDPIQTGGDGVFTIHGVNTSGNAIAGGQVALVVKSAAFPMLDTTLDLCDVTVCPVAPGEVDVVTKQPFPGFLPPMDLMANVKGKDSDGADLFCVDLSFKIVHPQ